MSANCIIGKMIGTALKHYKVLKAGKKKSCRHEYTMEERQAGVEAVS